MAMPMLIINMGGEMVYILNQRLIAQSVPTDKSHKVVHDVMKSMYNPKFISALFEPQAVYTNASVRQVFDRLAHSSIMRLNETSMDKLYDLMTMGMKYQLLACNGPECYIQIALNHLDNLRAMLVEQHVIDLVDDAQRLLVEAYANMSTGNLYLLKQTLLQFFHGRKVKVSIFLQEKVQKLDGSFKVFIDGPVVAGGEIPGTMRVYSDHGTCVIDSDGSDRDAFIFPWAKNCTPPFSGDSIKDRVCNLGNNMYEDEKNPNLRPYVDKAFQHFSKQAVPTKNDTRPKPSLAAEKSYSDGAKKATPTKHTSGRAELNLLANLLGNAVDETEGKSSTESQPFTINLFLGEDMFGAPSGANQEIARESERVRIDGKASRKSAAQQIKDLGFDSDEDSSDMRGGGKYNEDEEESDDDLLSMMDEASKK